MSGRAETSEAGKRRQVGKGKRKKEGEGPVKAKRAKKKDASAKKAPMSTVWPFEWTVSRHDADPFVVLGP